MSSIPFHVHMRRKIKDFFDSLLRYVSAKPSLETIPKEEINHILLIRINYRIGNMLFTTPMIEQLQKEFPSSKIDVLVGAPFTKVLFSGFDNVENIYDFPRDLLKHPIKLFAYVAKLRSNRYDVVININGGSTSDRLATMLAKAKYKVAFCNPNAYTPVNRCVKRQDTQQNHEALKPLELLKIFGIEPDYTLKLSISLSKEEKEWGKEELQKVVGQHGKKVVGIFRNARYDKKLPEQFWKELLVELQKHLKDVVFVDILSPDIPKKLQEDVSEYSQKDLRKLAAFMASLDAFICGDTGPMHLASASGVPTIALFGITAPDLYGTLKESDKSIVLKDKSVTEVAREISNHIASISQ